MSTVARLPVQHKDHPRCPACEQELPTFNDTLVSMCEITPCELVAIYFRVRCVCGSEWMLKKVRTEPDAKPKR